MSNTASSFHAKSTTDEVLAGSDLSGKNYIVTGGTTGIGRETVRALAAAGAKVLFTVRNLEKGEQAARQIKASTGNSDVHFVALDLTSIEQVSAFAQQSLENFSSLDGLILNAGAMIPELHRNQQGIEAQFMTHYVSGLMLAVALAPRLIAAAPSRIITVSSSGHKICPPTYEDINFENRSYSGFESYGQSKTAEILLAVELNRRLADKGVLSFAVHPGVIFDTELSRDVGGAADEEARAKEHGIPMDTIKTVEQGAATTVWAATSQLLAKTGGGRYLEDCGIAEFTESLDVNAGGVMPYAMDSDSAKKMWSLTEEMLATTFTID